MADSSAASAANNKYTTTTTKETKVEYGSTIRTLRENAGLSQKQLVVKTAKLGLPWHHSTLSRVEVGARKVNLQDLGIICEALDVTILDFLKMHETRSSGDIEAVKAVNVAEEVEEVEDEPVAIPFPSVTPKMVHEASVKKAGVVTLTKVEHTVEPENIEFETYKPAPKNAVTGKGKVIKPISFTLSKGSYVRMPKRTMDALGTPHHVDFAFNGEYARIENNPSGQFAPRYEANGTGVIGLAEMVRDLNLPQGTVWEAVASDSKSEHTNIVFKLTRTTDEK